MLNKNNYYLYRTKDKTSTIAHERENNVVKYLRYKDNLNCFFLKLYTIKKKFYYE